MLPEGSFQTPDLSWDGRQILFAFCTTDAKREHARFYHIYHMSADGTGLKQLTDGDYDDFSPRFLPNGQIVFVTTRRGGFHRCGSPACSVYTLAVMHADGSNLLRLSHHETQEWDPAVMHDGRIIYTRWDYVDRHAVFGEHLWTIRPDGTSPAAFYGNYTRNPVGIWEPQPVPGSHRIMATAAAHHAMTAGSIVLVDRNKGQDGLGPLTRLTPDTPFPESEFPVSGRWYFPAADAGPADSIENQRWPGHCYRSPWPLSERYFIAAYSFDALVGEPTGNPANMFGLYAVDAFGNKELIYRDEQISSLWVMPLRARPKPPVLPSFRAETDETAGTFLLQNTYAGDPKIPAGSVKRLRIVQVLPKTTQGRDNPPVGAAGGSPGKAVLGTVPVESDGSAYFSAPAKVPLLFQALDEQGRAVQIMRSATYLQPGESISCVGCHEPRAGSPPTRPAVAQLRQPSSIQPGPDGCKPFSYVRLVQGVLDKHCVSCHNPRKPEGKIVLSGTPQGHYTASYNALVRRVPYSNDTNGDSLSMPGRYGARGSPVMKLLLEQGHYDVKLSAEEIERLAIWMDTNALFYGTFDPAEQARQRNGEIIPAPGLQ
jgi:mono/diheme cytochrome c family protein